MQRAPQFNLASVVPLLRHRWRFVAAATAASGLVALFIALIRPSEYGASAEFFLRSPFYNDRNILFNRDVHDFSFYASDADLNRLQAIVQADTVLHYIINQFHLDSVYDFDMRDAKEREILKRQVGKNLRVWRTDNKSVQLTFYDRSPERAAAIVNAAVALVETNLHTFYEGTRSKIYQQLTQKIQEEDSSIHALTDTLVHLRDSYRIYDIVSPARGNIILSATSGNKDAPGYARGLEEIQNIESIKDQLVTDRARHLSIANEYRARANASDYELFYMIRRADASYKPIGMGKALTVLAGLAVGFCCSILFLVLRRLA